MTSPDTQSSPRALLDVVLLAVLSGVLVALWLLFAHDAWTYYTTPLTVRGYAQAHPFLRPSGSIGHLLGVAGTLFLFSTLFYVARRRLRWLARAGSVPRWLEFHIFCGVFGPVLITLHTSLKFNGIVSVAFWSMTLVVASGFIGRSLYVRIPKTIRGEELSRAELEERAAQLKAQLAVAAIPAHLHASIEEDERLLLSARGLRNALAARRRASRLRQEIRASGLNHELLHDVLTLSRERALLLRRLERLEKTRRLFQLWHVFHRPLVWVMFIVFFIHLGVAIYFGYTPFFGG